MDPEIVEYFDRRFDEAERRSRERFDEVERRGQERFDAAERRNQERFAAVNQRFDESERRFEHVDRQIVEVKDSVRHTNVVLEDLRSKVEIVAEGVMAVQERQDRDREELRGEIREVRTFVEVSYGALDRRLKVLEAN
jgi:archaellum component FlaC